MSNPTPVTWPKITSALKPNAALEEKVEALLAGMSVEEKVGQMIQPEIRHITPQDVKDFHLGSVLNGGGSMPNGNRYASIDDWVAMADSFYHASMDTSDGKLAIPIMWGSDAVHGVGNIVGATLFPHNIALGAANNPELIRQIGEITAREIAVTGLDWDFSPTVAVVRDDRWGRTYESYSEDPQRVLEYAGEMVNGLQGVASTTEFLDDYHVIATAKHFLGDGGTVNGIDRGDNRDDEATLRDVQAAGYMSALAAGVQTVMASFNSWHGERMHGHHYLLTDVLKNQMGFDGIVVGDWNGHGFIKGASVLDCPQAINAGLDIFMVADPNWKTLYHNTLAQLNSGIIPMSRADDAVRRILRVKLRAGLFDKGAPSTRALAGRHDLIGAPEHRAVARQAVRESLVLLKNKNNLLPLSPRSKVLVAGDGADNISKQTGGWSVTWQGTGNTMADFPGATTVWAGIDQAVTAAGGSAVLSADGSFSEKPDVAIVVFGEDPYAEMQGDVQNLLYKPADNSDWTLLKKLKAQGIPVVALFVTGRPLWINKELNVSDALAVIWQPGTEGGGVADVIFTSGDNKIAHDFVGRLTFSWPKRPDQGPLNIGDEHYDPLFAYGFGLSYGDVDHLGDDLSEEGMAVQKTSDILEIFNRRPLTPWQIEIEGSRNDRVAAHGNIASVSTLTVTAVDREMQEDARRVVWNGSGIGLVALSTSDRQVLIDYLNEAGALIVDLKVDKLPTSDVIIRVGCGPSCNSDLIITDEINAIVGQGWQTLIVDLARFPDVGSDFGLVLPPEEFFHLVLDPFTLVTDGELDLTFSRVRIEKHVGQNQGSLTN
jgi:beta-glucosidase